MDPQIQSSSPVTQPTARTGICRGHLRYPRGHREPVEREALATASAVSNSPLSLTYKRLVFCQNPRNLTNLAYLFISWVKFHTLHSRAGTMVPRGRCPGYKM